MTFDEMDLSAPLLQAVRTQGYATPTPIQEQAIPPVLAGRDVLGCAQTGTGKTAAFALPILHRFHATPPRSGRRPIRALVLAPTRELAGQIAESFTAYGAHTRLRFTVIFGGVNQNPQTRALERGVDVLVATPGRLLDLMGQGFVDLRAVEVFVLDEADRMLDMGFINDIRKVARALPRERQTLLFSATLAPEIRDLAEGLLRDPLTVSVAPVGRTVDLTEQWVCHVDKPDKLDLLVHLLRGPEVGRALVFTRTKHGADKVVRGLERASIEAAAIHGNKSQNNRERALDGFKRGTTKVLVATDIASRGLDIEQLSHVVNYDLPNEPEVYVHRIGRTGRAGCTGSAVSFCDAEERPFLADIERLIQKRIEVWAKHPFHIEPGHRTASRPAPSRPSAPRQYASRPAPRNTAPRPATSRPGSSHGASSHGAPAYGAPAYGASAYGAPRRPPTSPRTFQNRKSGGGNW
jgi:ATP-dependent RNA helicase RhlE